MIWLSFQNGLILFYKRKFIWSQCHIIKRCILSLSSNEDVAQKTQANKSWWNLSNQKPTKDAFCQEFTVATLYLFVFTCSNASVWCENYGQRNVWLNKAETTIIKTRMKIKETLIFLIRITEALQTLKHKYVDVTTLFYPSRVTPSTGDSVQRLLLC